MTCTPPQQQQQPRPAPAPAPEAQQQQPTAPARTAIDLPYVLREARSVRESNAKALGALADAIVAVHDGGREATPSVAASLREMLGYLLPEALDAVRETERFLDVLQRWRAGLAERAQAGRRWRETRWASSATLIDCARIARRNAASLLAQRNDLAADAEGADAIATKCADILDVLEMVEGTAERLVERAAGATGPRS